MKRTLIRASMRLFSAWIRRRAEAPASPGPAALPRALQEAQGVLVVALAEAGDMVLLSPFIRALRHLVPSARIALVTLPGSAPLYENCPEVDEVLSYPATTRLLRPIQLPRRAREFAARSLRGRFDVAIVPRWDTDQHLAGVVALYSGAARRVAFSEHVNPRKQALNAGFDRWFTDILESEGVGHEVERHLTLLQALGAPVEPARLALWPTAADHALAGQALPDVADRRRLVALGVGAAHPKRRWPIARFAEIGLQLQREIDAHVLIVGGPGDVQAQDRLLGALGPSATGLAGQLTLPQTAAALEHCHLFVGNDSAPLHLAASAGVPCVEISCHPADGDPLHHNAPERFGPWGVPSTIVRPMRATPPCAGSCSASGPHCILEVSPSTVSRASVALWNAADGRTLESSSERSTSSSHATTIRARDIRE